MQYCMREVAEQLYAASMGYHRCAGVDARWVWKLNEYDQKGWLAEARAAIATIRRRLPEGRRAGARAFGYACVKGVGP
jgi:hypothetical protein